MYRRLKLSRENSPAKKWIENNVYRKQNDLY